MKKAVISAILLTGIWRILPLSAQSLVDPATGSVSPALTTLGSDYLLEFSDEFNDNTIDATKWNIDVSSSSRAARPKLSINDWWWKSENVSETGGNAVLKVTKHDFNTMYCGSISSNNKYEVKYGYFEVRIKIAQADKGTHTAFWFQGDNMSNVDGTANDGAEVDVFESAWLGDYTKSVVHIDGYATDHQANTIQYTTPNLHTGFHTWGFHWEENFMKIYYDGVLKVTYSGDKWIPRVPEYIWLSDGASFGIEGDYFTSQAVGYLTEAQVDYIRVWRKSTGTSSSSVSDPEKKLYWELNASSTGTLPSILNDNSNNISTNLTDWILTTASSSTAAGYGNIGVNTNSRLVLSGFPKNANNSSAIKLSTWNGTSTVTGKNAVLARRLSSTTLNKTLYVAMVGSVTEIKGTTTNTPNANGYSYPLAFTNYTPPNTHSTGLRLLIYNSGAATITSADANYQFGLEKPGGNRLYNTGKTYVADGAGTGTSAVFILLKLVTDGNMTNNNDALSLYTSTTMPTAEPNWDITLSTGTDVDINVVVLRKKQDGVPYDHWFDFNNLRVADSWDGLFASFWNGSQWSIGEPSQSINAIIEGNITLNTNLTVKDILVKSGNSLKVSAGATLDVKGNIDNQGIFEILSGGSLLTYSGKTSSTVEIQRNSSFTDAQNRYSFIGSPVESFDISSLDGNHHYTYNTANDTYSAYSAGTMTPGKGYTSAGKQKLVFTGVPNTGTINVALSTSGNGFNFVSNPYPSAIDRASFVAANSAITGTIYLWDDGGSNAGQRTNSDFVTVNNAGSVTSGSGGTGASFNGYIGACQGFLVKASGAGNVTFTESMRVAGNNADGNFYRKPQSELFGIKINLENTTGFDQTLVAFTNDATEDMDRLWDADKDLVNNDIEIYSLLGDSKLAIQSLPELTKDQYDIDFGISVKSAGTYQVNLVESKLPKGYSAQLVNKSSGPVLPLSENPISLNLSAGSNSDYTLRISKIDAVLSNVESIAPLVLSKFEDNLKISFSENPRASTIEIRDISGRLLFKESHTETPTELVIPLKGNISNILILKAKTSAFGHFTQKFILEL